MIFVLGKNDQVERYVESIGLDIRNDIVYYPGCTDHYTEYNLLIQQIKEDNPPVVTTQNLEFIQCLLDSDLDFDVVTVFDNGVRTISKECANNVKNEMGLELRG